MKPEPVRTGMPVVAVTALLGLAVILLCALIGRPPTPSPAQPGPDLADDPGFPEPAPT